MKIKDIVEAINNLSDSELLLLFQQLKIYISHDGIYAKKPKRIEVNRGESTFIA